MRKRHTQLQAPSSKMGELVYSGPGNAEKPYARKGTLSPVLRQHINSESDIEY